MDAEWIKSPTARRILVHWADPRPAWLWSQDGTILLWRNAAARLFNARLKKNGLKLSAEAVPIRGQVARLIRLGSPGRSSLSRVQFLAADHPVAATCSCTPLVLGDGQTALLLVSVDRVGADIVEAAGGLNDDWPVRRLLPEGASYALIEDGRMVRGDADALARRSGDIDSTGLPAESDDVLRVKASPGDSWLLIDLDGPAPAAVAEVRAEEGEHAEKEPPGAAEDDLANMPEPMLPLGLEALPAAETTPMAASDEWVEPIPPTAQERPLSSLFDRLAEDSTLYGTLSAADEVFAGPPPEPVGETVAPPPIEELRTESDETPEAVVEPAAESAPSDEPAAAEEALPLDSTMLGSVIEYADDPEAPPASPPLQESRSLWMITGRGFRALERPPAALRAEPEPEPVPAAAPELAPLTVDAAPDAETAERVSRYNFEELGRILTDRVSGEAARAEPAPAPTARPVESVINLNAETLVLNRLPLAILVFRDQQVLFANRALTDLLGYESVDTLRRAGIAAIFPNDEGANAGPVNRLVRRDSTPLPVAARLQSVSWQGRPALMLSASPAEPIRTHEIAVRAFAEIAADAREEGFVTADRRGTITALSGHGGVLLGRPAQELTGKPLAVLVSKPDMEPLRLFLDKPARFAETARPSIALSTEDGDTDLLLFAEGQAGVVTGYFGFLRRRVRAVPTPPVESDADIEPGMLGRLSRGIRGPLNTIIGFADLIRSAALGTPGQERQAEYARDIRTAGLEIAVLADELDDFTRLRDGRYAPHPADIELGLLLDSCMVRVKSQAAGARVLVRSAISEQLPRVRADRASLGQALLNLLASAIDQTPVGGSVILSAQTDEDGNVAVHVRDGAESGTDLGDRFVVFRDGVDKDGQQLNPVRSSVGLALTRSLLAVNACTLSVDPTAGTGTLFSLLIPAELVVKA